MKDESTPKIDWRTESRNLNANHSIELVRCPSKGSNSSIVLTTKAFWHDTHYWRGKTQPCTGTHCAACRANAPIRELGFIAIMSPKDHRTKILQITSQAWHACEAYILLHGSLRGATIKQERPDGRKNGRVKTSIVSTSVAVENLPEPPDVRSIMEQIWEVTDRTTYADLRVAGGEGA